MHQPVDVVKKGASQRTLQIESIKSREVISGLFLNIFRSGSESPERLGQTAPDFIRGVSSTFLFRVCWSSSEKESLPRWGCSTSFLLLPKYPALSFQLL